MQGIYMRLFLILSLFAVINPSALPAATEQRIALVIGNSAYSSGPLKNPVNDATDMAATLQKLGFDVKVRDESDFWKNRNVEALAKTVGEWDTGLAAMFGAIKDAAGGQGMTVESPMSGRSDFEQLEMKGQGQIAKWVKAMPTPSAGEPHV